MILSGRQKGWTARQIADHINCSRFATSRLLSYTSRSIATKLGNLTRDRN
jgi:hypothetical protein